MSWTSTGAPLSIPDGPLIEDEQPIGKPSADVADAWAFGRQIADGAALQEGLFDDLLHPRNREGEWVETTHHPKPIERPVEGMTGRDLVNAFADFHFGDFEVTVGPRTRVNPTSMRAEPAPQRDGLHADLWLNITRQGKKVGFARIELKPPTHAGVRVALLHNLFLHAEHQNTGLGAALMTRLFSVLRAGKVDKMQLNAVEVGSYAWARAGFTWVKDKVAEQQRIMEGAVNSGAWDKEIVPHVSRTLSDQFVHKVALGEFSSEAEMAAFGRDEVWVDDKGRTMWIGKAVLLDSTWDGERAP